MAGVLWSDSPYGLFTFILITLSGTGKELLERPEVKSAYLEGGRQEVASGVTP